MGRRARFLVLAITAGATSACYVYQPVAGPPAVGERVRVELTREGAFRLSERSQAIEQQIEGVLRSRSGDSLSVEITTAIAEINFRTQRFTTFRNFQTSDVSQFEVRRLDWVRTGIVAAITAAAVGGLVGGVLTGGSDQSDGGGPSDPFDVRPPLIRFGIPIGIPIGFP